MAKKKPRNAAPKPAQFRSTPFGALKGVAMPEQVAAVAIPPEPVAVIEDDMELFRQAVAGVRPLQAPASSVERKKMPQPDDPGTVAARTATPPIPGDDAGAALFLQEVKRLRLEAKFCDVLPDDEIKPLAGNRLRQVKRGVIAVDHQLDLHGLTREEALAALPRFLNNARQKGRKAALVITGKGNNSPGEPVLQQAVTAWLRDAGRELILEFAPAPREMGGSGALIVFLRPQPACQFSQA